MRKQQSLVITLPLPCPESWDEMTLNGCGRFCGQCEKTVIDFTEMTDEEVIKIMTKSVNIPCGRFKETQLNRAIIIPEDKRSKPLLYIVSKIAVSFLLLQTITINSFGQKQIKAPTSQSSKQNNGNGKSDIKSSTKPLIKCKIIKGRIIDGESQEYPKEGLPGASIKIPGTDVITQTDLYGNFEIEFPAGIIPVLEITSYNYKSEIVNATDGIIVTLNESVNALVDVVITTSCGPPVSKGHFVGAADVISGKKVENLLVTDSTKNDLQPTAKKKWHISNLFKKKK